MKLINKISTYSLVTVAGLALTLSVAPDQAHSQAFKLGQTTSTTQLFNARGQSFNFTIAGNLAGTTSPLVTLQSIKFALNTTALVTPNLLVAYLYNLTTSAGVLPTNAALVTGVGSIAASTQATSITGDIAFAGNRTSLVFDFSSTLELATTDRYAVFLNRPSDFIVGATGDAIRGTLVNSYGGTGVTSQIAYRNGGASPISAEPGLFFDTAFIVDATAVPFEFEASGGMTILGGLFLANKIRKRNLETKNEEKA